MSTCVGAPSSLAAKAASCCARICRAGSALNSVGSHSVSVIGSAAAGAAVAVGTLGGSDGVAATVAAIGVSVGVAVQAVVIASRPITPSTVTRNEFEVDWNMLVRISVFWLK